MLAIPTACTVVLTPGSGGHCLLGRAHVHAVLLLAVLHHQIGDIPAPPPVSALPHRTVTALHSVATAGLCCTTPASWAQTGNVHRPRRAHQSHLTTRRTVGYSGTPSRPTNRVSRPTESVLQVPPAVPIRKAVDRTVMRIGLPLVATAEPTTAPHVYSRTIAHSALGIQRRQHSSTLCHRVYCAR